MPILDLRKSTCPIVQKQMYSTVYVCVCGEKNYKNNACNRKSELCNMIS